MARFCVRMDRDNGMGGRDHACMVRMDAATADDAKRAAEMANPSLRAYEVMTEEEWGAQ